MERKIKVEVHIPYALFGARGHASAEVVQYVRALTERLGRVPSPERLRREQREDLARELCRQPTEAEVEDDHRVWLWMKRLGVSRAEAIEGIASSDAKAAERKGRVYARDLARLREYLELTPEGKERPKRPSKPMSAKHQAMLDEKKARREERDINFASRKARAREYSRRLRAGLIPLGDNSGPEGMEWTPSAADIDMKVLAECREHRREAERIAAEVRRLQMKAATEDLSMVEFYRLRDQWEKYTGRTRLRPWSESWWEYHSAEVTGDD